MNVFVVILDHEGVKAAKEVSARLQHALPELFELSEGVFVVAGDMLTETVAQAAGLKGEDRIAEATGAVFKVGPYEKLAKAPPSNVTLPPIDAEPEEIAQALFQRPQLKKPSAEDAGESQKVCPECGHVFQGNGWDGIDAHWRSKHEDIMPYEEAWPLLRDGKYMAQAPAISN
jgi:hypothetical protein